MFDLVYAPFAGDQITRLIHQGRVKYDVDLNELMRLSSSAHVRLHLEFGMPGGTGSKEQLKGYVKNALAATLLEQGFPFQWTADTIDALLTAVGAKKLTQLAAMPAGQARLEQLLQMCRHAAIEIPNKVAKEAAEIDSKGMQLRRDCKRQALQPNPEDYALELTYLKNEDGWSQHWMRDPSCPNPDEVDDMQTDSTGQLLWQLLPTIGWDNWTNPHTTEAWKQAI